MSRRVFHAPYGEYIHFSKSPAIISPIHRLSLRSVAHHQKTHHAPRKRVNSLTLLEPWESLWCAGAIFTHPSRSGNKVTRLISKGRVRRLFKPPPVPPNNRNQLFEWEDPVHVSVSMVLNTHTSCRRDSLLALFNQYLFSTPWVLHIEQYFPEEWDWQGKQDSWVLLTCALIWRE